MRQRLWFILLMVVCGTSSIGAVAQEIDTRQAFPLGPLQPKDAKECQAYGQQINAIKSRFDKLHEDCLTAHKRDATDKDAGGLVCSKDACQNLHDVVYGNQGRVADKRLEECNDEVSKYQALQQQIKEDKEKRDAAKKAMDDADARAKAKAEQTRQDAILKADNAQINANNNATNQVNAVTGNLESQAQQSRDQVEQSKQLADDLRNQADSIKQQGIQVDTNSLNQLAGYQSAGTSTLVSANTDNLPAAQDSNMSAYLANIEQKAHDYAEAKTVDALKQGITDWASDKIGKFAVDHIEATYDMYGKVKDVSLVWAKYNGPDDAESARAVGDGAGIASDYLFSNPVQRKDVKANTKTIGNIDGSLYQSMDNGFELGEGDGALDAQIQAEINANPTIKKINIIQNFNTNVTNGYEQFRKKYCSWCASQ